MKPETKQVYAFVKFEDQNYWSKARICKVEFVGRSEDFSRLEATNSPLDHLIVRAQITPEFVKDGFYGYSVQAHDLCTSSYEVLESVAKVMRQIEKKMSAMNDKFGWPTSFSEWLVRLCDILKIDQHVKTSRYSDQWVTANVGDLRYTIDQSAHEFADSVKVGA